MLDIKIDSVKKVVSQNGYKKVVVLLPAGVMARVDELLGVIPEPVFLASPCYGSCDVPLHLLDELDADAIFNLGHSDPKGVDYPDNVHFFELQVRSEVPDFVPGFRRVGLVYVVQYRDSVEEYAKRLEEAGREVVLGGEPDFMGTHRAQVTGCDIGAARAIAGRVDGFVVASDGLFHANAVAVLGKPTLNWFGEVAGAPEFPMASLFAAERVGILTGLKPGQDHGEEAEEARKKLEKLGKKVLMVSADVLTPEVTNFQVDFWVVAACPRLSEEDYLSPSAPVKEVLEYL